MILKEILPYLSVEADVRVFDTLESTNTTAKEYAVAGAAQGTVIIADYLTGARGRHGRRFFTAPACGIYLSAILRPEVSNGTALVTARAAVSVCEAVEAVTVITPQIKWVNDVYVNNRKVCGILAETVAGAPWLIVGIGINFVQPVGGFPRELADSAGVLYSRDETPPITRERLAAEVINRVVGARVNDTLIDAYRRRLMLCGRRVFVTNAAKSDGYSGVALDVDEQCRLLVRRDCGEVVALSSGEVSVVV
ncbi:MAG: biotin--[acetyl-CoA-carboxylase] ligase [Oscillospiraceae bacterium]|nr:biotin--[acetyl-CoA-carboxylase] ligase [Oscillospiraceae bacterium]